jgi:RNA polymerase sigma factor (sigma-70 family)
MSFCWLKSNSADRGIVVNQNNMGIETYLGDALATIPDESLVTLAKSGEHLAYVELCKRHSTMVLRTINRITRNKEDSEDALQDSLLRAFTHLQTFDGRSTFSTWLTRIAINSALMILRKKRSRPESSFDDDVLGHFQIPDVALDPERRFFRREGRRVLRRAVRGLPPILRDVTVMRYEREASLGEVAALTGISIAAAKSRLLRARNSLRRALGEDETTYRNISVE